MVDDDNTMLVSGAYECVAENDNGVGTSEPLEVRVLCKLLSTRTRASNKSSPFAPTWLHNIHPIYLYSCHSIPCYKLLETHFTVSGNKMTITNKILTNQRRPYK